MLDETRGLYSFDFDGEGLQRSMRAACAIEDLVAAYELDAGAMNCHVPEIRFGGIGVTPCFGLGRSASLGVPWTCTGDVLTAVALFISKALGGAAQYHELETYDYETGEFVVASSGEHDLGLAPGVRPELVENAWFAGDPCTGVCACFSAPAGPATLLSLADIGGDYRLIAAAGSFTGRSFPSTGTANAGFRFDRGLEGWTDVVPARREPSLLRRRRVSLSASRARRAPGSSASRTVRPDARGAPAGGRRSARARRARLTPCPGPARRGSGSRPAGSAARTSFSRRAASAPRSCRSCPGTRPRVSSISLGRGSRPSRPGDQVAIYYIENTPDAPRPNLGPNVRRMGVDVDGAFAEYVVRPVSTLIRPSGRR